MWHIFNHFYVSKEDNFGKIHDFATKKSCFQDNCQDSLEAFETIDEESKRNLQDLMKSQPKIHGDMHTDFVLIPQCSFGNVETLTDCTLFKESKFKYQDNTCYTFDQSEQSQVGRNNGLNLILNLKSIPKEEPSTLKLFVHQPGTAPDVLHLVSGFEEIRENSWTNIGIQITSYETTKNFEEMYFEKRKCLIPAHQNRTECLANLVHNQALQKC